MGRCPLVLLPARGVGLLEPGSWAIEAAVSQETSWALQRRNLQKQYTETLKCRIQRGGRDGNAAWMGMGSGWGVRMLWGFPLEP